MNSMKRLDYKLNKKQNKINHYYQNNYIKNMKMKQVNAGINFTDGIKIIFSKTGNIYLIYYQRHYLEREIPELN